MPDFTDSFVSDTSYTGLDDTAWGYSGSSAVGDVTPGSALPLDSSWDSYFHNSGSDTFSTPDFATENDPWAALSLSGVSDPPFESASSSTPYPNAAPASDSMWSGFSSLAKLGSSFATLFGNHPSTVYQAPPSGSVNGYGVPVSTPAGTGNGTTTIMLLIVVAAAALLLLKGD